MATVKYEWYWREEKTATITVDFSRRKVVVENHSDEIRKLPFRDIQDVTFSTFEQRIARMVPPMALSAAACGADGLIIEVHNDPIHALCDGAQSLRPEEYAELVKKVNAVRAAVR